MKENMDSLLPVTVVQDAFSDIFSNTALMQVYSSTILLQGNLTLPLVLNVQTYQRLARTHAGNWEQGIFSNYQQFYTDFLSLCHQYLGFYGELTTCANSLDQADSLKNFQLGLKLLSDRMKENQTFAQTMQQSIVAFDADMLGDYNNFSDLNDAAMAAYEGDSGNIEKLQEQLQSIHDKINDDIVKIALWSAAVAVTSAAITIAMGVLPAFPELDVPLLLGSIGVEIAAVVELDDAINDLIEQKHDYADTSSELAREEAQLAALAVIYQQFCAFVKANKSAALAIGKVIDTWTTLLANVDTLNQLATTPGSKDEILAILNQSKVDFETVIQSTNICQSRNASMSIETNADTHTILAAETVHPNVVRRLVGPKKTPEQSSHALKLARKSSQYLAQYEKAKERSVHHVHAPHADAHASHAAHVPHTIQPLFASGAGPTSPTPPTSSIGASDIQTKLAPLAAASWNIQTYVTSVLHQGDITITLKTGTDPNTVLSQSRQHAQGWQSTYQENVDLAISDIVGFSNKFLTFYNTLYGYANQIVNGPQDVTTRNSNIKGFNDGLNILNQYIASYQAHIAASTSDLGTFNTNVISDYHAFDDTVTEAQNEYTSANGEIPTLNLEIEADRSAISSDLTKIGLSAAAEVGSLLAIGVAVAVSAEFPGVSVILVIGALVSIGVSTYEITEAAKDIAAQNSDINDKTAQVNADTASLTSLTYLKTSFGGFRDSAGSAMDALSQLQTTWSRVTAQLKTLANDFSQSNLSPDEGTYLLKSLEAAKEDTATLQKLATQNQQQGTLPVQPTITAALNLRAYSSAASHSLSTAAVTVPHSVHAAALKPAVMSAAVTTTATRTVSPVTILSKLAPTLTGSINITQYNMGQVDVSLDLGTLSVTVNSTRFGKTSFTLDPDYIDEFTFDKTVTLFTVDLFVAHIPITAHLVIRKWSLVSTIDILGIPIPLYIINPQIVLQRLTVMTGANVVVMAKQNALLSTPSLNKLTQDMSTYPFEEKMNLIITAINNHQLTVSNAQTLLQPTLNDINRMKAESDASRSELQATQDSTNQSIRDLNTQITGLENQIGADGQSLASLYAQQSDLNSQYFSLSCQMDDLSWNEPMDIDLPDYDCEFEPFALMFNTAQDMSYQSQIDDLQNKINAVTQLLQSVESQISAKQVGMQYYYQQRIVLNQQLGTLNNLSDQVTKINSNLINLGQALDTISTDLSNNQLKDPTYYAEILASDMLTWANAAVFLKNILGINPWVAGNLITLAADFAKTIPDLAKLVTNISKPPAAMLSSASAHSSHATGAPAHATAATRSSSSLLPGVSALLDQHHIYHSLAGQQRKAQTDATHHAGATHDEGATHTATGQLPEPPSHSGVGSTMK